jgi:hypothetical protein
MMNVVIVEVKTRSDITTKKLLTCCFSITANVSGLCVVALSRNLKLTTTLDGDITQNPCYVPFLFRL